MKREMFFTLFKDLISHLYDVTVIETHPLSQYFPIGKTSDSSTCRADAIQKLILQEIELLRPQGNEPQPQSPEWRPYLILFKRYVLGESPRDIASALYIGDRQFRRDHSRALQALSSRIWERYFFGNSVNETVGTSSSEDDFVLHLEKLDLSEVLRSLEKILAQRFQIEQLHLDLKMPSHPITISADRVLLRQILLSLVNYGLQLCAGNSLGLWLESQPDNTVIHINFETDEQWEINREEGKDLLNYIRAWAQRMRVQIDEHYPPPGQRGNVSIKLIFAPIQHHTILIVDDQAAALKMFERYLSHTGVEVVGITNPEQTLEVAGKIQPDLIILDVMMPRLDGWEVLQALQLNPKTSKIPILVCSAWDEPELAYSLGAAAFLKKPILQRQLLDVLYQLNMLD
ncbi:MAG: response regulator [Thermanaerothrix sp.]|uniref:response regulator n=1 Tax=Thermanaerothrix sp. TaxID=2972675 RepID=UPI003C7AEA8E